MTQPNLLTVESLHFGTWNADTLRSGKHNNPYLEAYHWVYHIKSDMYDSLLSRHGQLELGRPYIHFSALHSQGWLWAIIPCRYHYKNPAWGIYIYFLAFLGCAWGDLCFLRSGEIVRNPPSGQSTEKSVALWDPFSTCKCTTGGALFFCELHPMNIDINSPNHRSF